MSLKIFHTSDVHLGMKFSRYPEVQEDLANMRFSTLERLVQRSNEEKCDMFVIAGDLFDKVSVSKKDILRTAQILNTFQGNILALLPGNHDYITGEEGDLWSIFEGHAGDNVKVLKSKQVESLQHYDLDVNIYPAPCNSKHSSENCIGWIKDEQKDPDILYHIGIAHGSLDGFSPDFDGRYFPMTHSQLNECEMDLWLMGHTHIQYPDKPGPRDRIFYPATPEPDGFDCRHEGKAWILEIDEDKKIKAESISTGNFFFMDCDVALEHDSRVDLVLSDLIPTDASNVLLKLKLKGRLSEEEYETLKDIRSMVPDLFYFKPDYSEVTQVIDPKLIEKEFTEGSFPYALLSKLTVDESDQEALQVAYELMKELKS
ncbi:MAG: repair protein SbcD/Mre11 [Methanolobus sp.]|nr:repair protein SbcD/Mre11 [Methanolobus sp.]